MADYLLNGAPADGIAGMVFSPRPSNELLVASWDCTTRLYDISNNSNKFTFHFDRPMLGCCFDGEGFGAFTGGLDGVITAIDLTRGTKQHINKHNEAVSCMAFNRQHECLLSGSWDQSISVCDGRSNKFMELLTIPGKVYTLSTSCSKLVVGTSTKQLIIYDMRNLSKPQEIRESPLRHQIRKVACSIDGESFAVGSVEGRLAYEFIDESPDIQAKKYAFKCHRKGDVAYPINAIDFNPIYGTFATGGCDGFVNIWDGANKKRICNFGQYATSIAALSFSADGNILAIASSYTYEEGDIPDKPEDAIYLHMLNESEVKPRVKATEA